MLEKLMYSWPIVAILSCLLAFLLTKGLACCMILNIFIGGLIGVGIGYSQAYLKKVCKDGDFQKINIVLSIVFGIMGGIIAWL